MDNTYVISTKTANYLYIMKNGSIEKLEDSSDTFFDEVTLSSLFIIIDDNSIFNMIKSDSKMKLKKVDFNGTKCYKLNVNSEIRPNYTVYFDTKTYMPIAVDLNGNNDIIEVKINIGNLTDKDMFISQIKEYEANK